MLTKLYRAYDKIREPYRFLTFLGIFVPIIVATNWGPIWFRLTALCILAFAAVTRMLYLNR